MKNVPLKTGILVPLVLVAAVIALPTTARAQQEPVAALAPSVLVPAPADEPAPAQPPEPAVAPAQPQPVYYAYAPETDPYGFTNWLNGTRAAYGLPPVGYDPNLAGWAHVNNTHQNAYGMGHHVMGPARRQNSAMGDYMSVPAMWMNSPAHCAALLDPSIRWIGIAGLGAYWTFNAY